MYYWILLQSCTFVFGLLLTLLLNVPLRMCELPPQGIIVTQEAIFNDLEQSSPLRGGHPKPASRSEAHTIPHHRGLGRDST